MKPSLGLAAKMVTVLLLVLALGIVLFDRHHKSPTTALKPGSNSSTTVTQQNSRKPAATTTISQSPVQPKKGLSVSDEKQLAQRAQNFLSAYYLIKPDDTVAARRRRVAGYVAAKSLPLLYLGLGGDTAANASRIERQLTQHATVDRSLIKTAQPTSNPADQVARTPVTVTMTRPDGKQVSRFALHIVSEWRLTHGQWFLVDFDKGEGG